VVDMTPTILQPTARRMIGWLREKTAYLEKQSEEDDRMRAEQNPIQPKYEDTQEQPVDLAMSIIIAPNPHSPMSTPSLAGSDYVTKYKITISPAGKERVAEELEKATEEQYFKQWPLLECGTITDRARSPSPEFQIEQSDEQKRQRERIMVAWKAKEERPITGRRRRIPGGTEDVEENVLIDDIDMMFKPTLDIVPSHYHQRFVKEELEEQFGMRRYL